MPNAYLHFEEDNGVVVFGRALIRRGYVLYSSSAGAAKLREFGLEPVEEISHHYFRKNIECFEVAAFGLPDFKHNVSSLSFEEGYKLIDLELPQSALCAALNYRTCNILVNPSNFRNFLDRIDSYNGMLPLSERFEAMGRAFEECQRLRDAVNIFIFAEGLRRGVAQGPPQD